MMSEEISGVRVYFHKPENRKTIEVRSQDDSYSIYFIVFGELEYSGKTLSTLTTIIPENDSCLKAAKDNAGVLEIKIFAEKKEISELNKRLPIILKYDLLPKYTEDCKSEKTVSRMIFNDGDIPGFTMGSVEVCGPDAVSEHSHPEVDQFFFSLPENLAELKVDGSISAFGGCSIVHIPLGSAHSLSVREGAKLHYLWCDRLIDEKSSDYIRTAHKML